MEIILKENTKILKVIIRKKKEANYGIINDVMYEWYIKCCLAGVYPDGTLLQERLLKLRLN